MKKGMESVANQRRAETESKRLRVFTIASSKHRFLCKPATRKKVAASLCIESLEPAGMNRREFGESSPRSVKSLPVNGEGSLGGERAALPSAGLVQQARALLLRRYRVSVSDVDDLVEDALLSYLTARSRGGEVRDGLFFVMACRRALDYARRRRLSASPPRVRREPGKTDVEPLEAEWLVRHLRRFLIGKPSGESGRMVGVVREILADSSWSEACRSAGIPRGSESRYRGALRQCFGILLRPPAAAAAAPQRRNPHRPRP